jgi:branched-chain amino acid transport system substrate-binding protein
VSLLLLATAGAVSSPAGAQGSSPTPSGQSVITVGALLSLTGDWQSLGVASQSAVELAARDVNASLANKGMGARVQVIVRDTKLNPDTALQQLEALAAQGVRVVIGPQSSAEVQALKSYADQNGIVLISQGSTASSLAIADDNIFRLVPDDTHEAAAIAALMQADGIHTVVPVWRNDAGNQGLVDSLKRDFQARGGAVTNGVRYEPNQQSAASSNFAAELQAIKSQISQAIAGSGARSVGVYLGAFDEAASLFSQAGADPVLSSVRWYGGDGSALSKALIGNSAADFAARVGFPCPTYGLDDTLTAKWKPISDQILAQTGIAPDALALSAYDALCTATLAAVQAGGTGDPAAFKRAFVQVTSSFSGITGPVALNEAGDRRAGAYDFWAVCGPSASAWTRVAVYKPLPDGTRTISRLPGCP